MQFGLSISHRDHGYLERRGGAAFLSHLRGASGRATYRKLAIERAADIHQAALDSGEPAESVCGAGLLVLQRAALASEDLGVLLHALAQDNPALAATPGSSAGADIWPRMTSANVGDLMTVFRTAVEQPTIGLRPFRLPPDEALDEEGLPADAKAAAQALRALTADRWARMLGRVAEFWLTYGDIAKSTMHGFAAVSGRHIVEPPGAGVLSQRVSAPDGPFVVMVNSHVRGRRITTPLLALDLGRPRIDSFVRAGTTAVKVCLELSEALNEGITSCHAYGIPPLLFRRLSESQKAALLDNDPGETA